MSAHGGLPSEVARLIANHIHSVEQLEVLLLLQRTAPVAWTAEQVAAELRIAASSAAGRLGDLAKRGFLAAGREGFSYFPGRIDSDVRLLAEAYRERRVTVITAIFTKPDPIRALADAFRFGGGGGGEGGG